MTTETLSLYAWKWIPGGAGKRPMRPSEMRVTVNGTVHESDVEPRTIQDLVSQALHAELKRLGF